MLRGKEKELLLRVVREEYNNHATVKRLAEHVGYSEYHVRMCLREQGLPTKMIAPGKKVPKKAYDWLTLTIVADYRQGKKLRDIADSLNQPMTKVRNRLYRYKQYHNITLRREN